MTTLHKKLIAWCHRKLRGGHMMLLHLSTVSPEGEGERNYVTGFQSYWLKLDSVVCQITSYLSYTPVPTEQQQENGNRHPHNRNDAAQGPGSVEEVAVAAKLHDSKQHQSKCVGLG